MEDDGRSSDWVEYRRLILSELERIGKEINLLNQKFDRFRVDDLASIRTDIALLKFQAAMWGATAGSLFAVIVTATFKFLIK